MICLIDIAKFRKQVLGLCQIANKCAAHVGALSFMNGLASNVNQKLWSANPLLESVPGFFISE